MEGRERTSMKFPALLQVLGFFLIAAPVMTAAQRVHSVAFKGTDRTFRVFAPDGAAGDARQTPAPPLPVVLAIHGGGTNGETMARYSGLSEKASKAGFIVVYPDGTGRLPRVLTWNSGGCCGYAQARGIDDVGFLREVVAFVIRTYNGDPARVYATGISNGAMMAYRMAIEAPDIIAAVAAVAGTLDVDPALVKVPKPILHFHGTEDEFVPWNGGRGPKTSLGNKHRSVPETIAAWVRVDGANSQPESVTLPDKAKDGTVVIRHDYAPKPGGFEVILYEIRGAGHTWPGRARDGRLLGKATANIDANDIIWEFFSRYTLKKG
jgi:polyhydroxybutyrate depolymerase